MGKILLVEPSRILRLAISLFLFPENDVRATERIAEPKAESLEGYDLLILDGPELRERGWWSAELEAAVQRSAIPVLWLEDEEGVEHAAKGKQQVLKKPVVRDALRSAAASFLSAPAPRKKPTQKSASSREEKVQAAPKPEAGESAREKPQQEAFDFIDLVDAVEEAPAAEPKTSTPKSR